MVLVFFFLLEEELGEKMKPPARKRAAPSRFKINESPGPARTLRLAWTVREKMQLLKGLKAQKNNKVPKPVVQGRSQSQVSSYIAWLCGRAAREAVQTEYEKWVQEKRRKSPPSNIEMLTIASTEPVTLHYSIPSKEPKASASKPTATARVESDSQQKGSSEEEPTSSGEVPPSEEEKQADDKWKKLDFEKIYKYLAKAAKGETLLKLSECESAVVLNLLNCLPDQLQTLKAKPLSACLRKTHAHMNSRHDLKLPSKEEEPGELQEPNWKEMRFCPLNPFLVPVELLQPKEDT
ncbi:snRNA-activating protein complex subunit 2 [Gastrophryne carolinensis]